MFGSEKVVLYLLQEQIIQECLNLQISEGIKLAQVKIIKEYYQEMKMKIKILIKYFQKWINYLMILKIKQPIIIITWILKI